jgi:hypothetical protein
MPATALKALAATAAKVSGAIGRRFSSR